MVEVNGIGFSNKAIAFRVTICTINGGKPVDSNGICEWISIPKLNICCEIMWSRESPMKEYARLFSSRVL